MSDTPRTNKAVCRYTGGELVTFGVSYVVPVDFALKLERELNAANERIKRMEAAGDEMSHTCVTIDADRWRKAKEAKP